MVDTSTNSTNTSNVNQNTNKGVTNAQPASAADLEIAYGQMRTDTTMHKALDFSNIGMPSKVVNGAIVPSAEKHLRQYHQTRIFIYNFGAMRGHGSSLGPQTYLISANLPETLSYKIGSKWEAPLSFLGNVKFNAAMQILSGSNLGKAVNFDKLGAVSGVHRASTLKIWSGAEPLSLRLDIPVIDDNYNTNRQNGGISTNLTEALEYLGCLCLPAGISNTGFYTPPPSPLSGSVGFKDLKFSFSTTNYARIMVQIGGILLIDRCVIKGIEVTYPKTKTLIKHNYASNLTGASNQTYLAPLLAKVNIEVETIEALTANTYSNMLWLRQQSAGYIDGELDYEIFGKNEEAQPAQPAQPAG